DKRHLSASERELKPNNAADEPSGRARRRAAPRIADRFDYQVRLHLHIPVQIPVDADGGGEIAVADQTRWCRESERCARIRDIAEPKLLDAGRKLHRAAMQQATAGFQPAMLH